MKKLALPPGNNFALLAALGVGAWYMLTRPKAQAVPAGGVRSPAGPSYFTTPSRAGESLQQQAARAGVNQSAINAAGGLLGSILNSKLFGGSGALQPSGVTEAARAAVRAGDPYYTSPPPSSAPALTTGDFARMDRASGYNTIDDGSSIVTADARAAVRFGDPYYGGDSTVANPIASWSGGGATGSWGYANDAVALNPAPGSTYSMDVYDIPDIPAEYYDYG